MNTTWIAVIIVLIVSVGIYIGATNLMTMYGVEPSGSTAGLVACSPETAESRPNQPVRFNASGLAGALYHWSTDEGRSEVTAQGGLEVRYTTAGQKTVYVFHAANDRWYRTACQVEIR